MIITFLASILIWMLVGLVLLVARPVAFRAVLAFVVAVMISQGLKTVIPTARPVVLGATTQLTLTQHYDNAFPSTHTAAIFAMAVTVWFYNRRLGAIYIGLATLVGVSRVWANVHWPIDIVGGAIIGTFIAVILHKWRLLDPKTSRN